MLLDSMAWTKVKQQEKYLQTPPSYTSEFQSGGVFYKDHLLILQNDPRKKKTTLCCLNLGISFLSFSPPLIIFLETKNTWLTFDINGLSGSPDVPTNNLLVYNGLLLAFGTVNGYKDFTLLVLNLESK